MAEETLGYSRPVQGQGVVPQSFSCGLSRTEIQTTVDSSGKDGATAMPEGNVRHQSELLLPVCIPAVDKISLASSSSSRSKATQQSQETQSLHDLSDFAQNDARKDDSVTLQTSTTKEATVTSQPEVSAVEAREKDETVFHGLEIPSSSVVSKARNLDSTDAEVMTSEIKWRRHRTLTRRKAIAKNAQHQEILDCQETRACAEIPRPILTDILEEAVPVVQKTVQIYKRELGARDSLTTQTAEHLKKLKEKLAKLNMQ